jgi:hypothetical protein
MKLLLISFLALGSTSALAQKAPIDDRLDDCVERLRLPDYPVLAVQARIMGEVVVAVRLKTKLSFKDMEIIGNPHPLLVKAVWQGLSQSSFAAACNGRTVRLKFRFAIEGDPVSGRDPAKLYFAYPNTFWITTPLLYINP